MTMIWLDELNIATGSEIDAAIDMASLHPIRAVVISKSSERYRLYESTCGITNSALYNGVVSIKDI